VVLGQSRCIMSLDRGVKMDMRVYIRDRDIVPASYSAAKRVQVFLGLVPAGVSSYKGDAGRGVEPGTYRAWRVAQIGRGEKKEDSKRNK
jgi:hypothetical protein